MSKQEIFDFLMDLDLCKICILRYLNGRCTDYLDVDKALLDRDVIQISEANGESNIPKRVKSNICPACLGIFQDDMIERAARQVIDKTNLHTYECDTIYTSVSLPILLQIRELSLWIALLEKFPDSFSKTQLPNISIKEIFKFLTNIKLCKETNRTLEQNQNGILVNVFFDHDSEADEVARLKNITPRVGPRPTNKKSRGMTRNAFEKSYYPENLNLDDCIKHLPVPPVTVSSPIKLLDCTVSGPTIFVAGRYRKLSRHLSQSPWILGGKRVMEESVQEIIARDITPYFGVDPVTQATQIVFMASGREDVDVRCLGNGRPFVLEISNSKKVKLPIEEAAEMENRIDDSEKVSVHHLQICKREDLVHIKTGEEKKKKMYRALCILEKPATVEVLSKLNIPEGMLLNQVTPLRVLHRRPLLARPRQVYSVKAFVDRDNPRAIILDMVTQAGTYVKELVHGEFGRTDPSISSIIGQAIDIVALDVNGIDLDWPNAIDNKVLSQQQIKQILIEKAQ